MTAGVFVAKVWPRKPLAKRAVADNELMSTDVDIAGNLDRYLHNRESTARYSSFDYCFNHFQSHRDRLDDLLKGDTRQLSCLHLGFYLASWGMLRGGTELLQRSAATYGRVVETLITAPAHLWTLDVNRYNDRTIGDLLEFGEKLRPALHDRASDTLVTKVLLGTMGCVPALDRNFRRGFHCSTFRAQDARENRRLLPGSRRRDRRGPEGDAGLRHRPADAAALHPGEGPRHGLLHRGRTLTIAHPVSPSTGRRPATARTGATASAGAALYPL